MSCFTKIAIFCVLGLYLYGCQQEQIREPIWDNVQIKDLAPDDPSGVNSLKTMNFDIRILEIPADNIRQLNDLRRLLEIRTLQFHDELAFSANYFSVYIGKNQNWSTVRDSLLIAGAKQVNELSLMLPDQQFEDIVITRLNQTQKVFFTSTTGRPEAAHIGPGILALHIKTEYSQSQKQGCILTAYPIFTLMSGNVISELSARTRLRDFPFLAAAFRAEMKPGDFIFLAPERYISDQSALAGLFFCNPQGNLFINEFERKPPERKPAVRVFLIACVGVNY